MLLATNRPDPANIALAARPLRACVLVGEHTGLDWPATFTAAIGAICRIWGAQASLLVPAADDLADSELFWALASLLDPDIYMRYVPSWEDLRDIAPEAHDEHRAALERELAGTGSDPAPVVAEQMKRHASQASLPAGLEQQLVAVTAPLDQEVGLPVGGMLDSAGANLYPLSDALKLRPLPEALTVPAVSTRPVERLLLAAEFGALSPALRDDLTEARVEIDTRELPDRTELLRWIYAVGGPGWAAPPFDLGMQGLAWFGPNPPSRRTSTLVVGEDPWDFALAYALRRMRTLAWWLPESYVPDAVERAWALSSVLHPSVQSAGPLVVTTTSDDDAADRVASELSSRAGSADAVRRAHWRESLPARPNRLLVRDRVGFTQPFHLQHGRTTPLDTPVPSFAEGSEELAARWMTDVELREGWVHARHPRLGATLVCGSPAARTTGSGPAYLGPGLLVQGGVPLALQTDRPRIEPLALQEQLAHVATAAGWTCRLSEKGQFTVAATEIFGGFDGLCTALRREPLARVLMGYLDGAGEAPGIPLSDRRRYLAGAELEELADDEHSEELLSELTASRALTAGIVLKCSRCRHTAWYRPRDFDPTFTCPRCAAQHRVDESTRIEHPEPAWRYRLDETIFQFLRHRSDLPVLAASARFASSLLTVGVVPEIELTDPAGDSREIDFVVSEGGDVWVGEAFTAARYASSAEAERLRQLAEVATLFNARGVILATAASELSAATRDRASSAVPGPRPVWEERAGCELLARPASLIDEPG